MREFLKELELDKEVVEKIMGEYGKSITAEKEKSNPLKEKIKELEASIDERNTTINELNKKIEEGTKSLEDLQNVANENKDLKAQLQMSDSNVKKEFSKFVTSEVMNKVNDEVDFATALKTYKEENPQYFGETIVKKTQTSLPLNGNTPKAPTTNDIMNDIIRGAKEN